jgi:hypothetical protein
MLGGVAQRFWGHVVRRDFHRLWQRPLGMHVTSPAGKGATLLIEIPLDARGSLVLPELDNFGTAWHAYRAVGGIWNTAALEQSDRGQRVVANHDQ